MNNGLPEAGMAPSVGSDRRAGRPGAQIRAEIEAEFGFFPPFFVPALQTPQVLENLWQQTLSAYLDNPLPILFKETLAAYLGRFCRVSYCLVCHSCLLRPLGLDAAQILTLLQSPPPAEVDVLEQLRSLSTASTDGSWHADTAVTEDLLQGAVALYLVGPDTSSIRDEMRRVLGAIDYQHLVTYLSYIRTCQEWMEAHPEVTYEADKRILDNLGGLLAEQPALSEFFRTYPQQVEGERLRLARLSDQRRYEQALLERVRLATFNSEVSTALTADGSLGDILHRCTDAVVRHLDAAFARIWTLDERREVLVLEASSGMYTHLDGAHATVPVGRFKIGLIAQERKAHLTNTVVGDPLVSEQEWAVREGMIAFAGYPLMIGERLVGVVAMFARHSLNEATTQALASVANGIALGIERKRTEAQRVLLLEREQKARVLAEEANRIKDEFLATLGHELRSPLNAILGWVQMLRGGRLNAVAQANALEVVERNARAQNKLIEDLLDVSRIITGKLRLDVQAVEMTAIITAALDTIRPAAEAKTVRLTTVLDPKAVTVAGDPNRLQQVIWNLLSNAVKFTPKGGRVQVELLRVNSHVEIVVTDSGAGIAPEVLPHVFERFRQADSTTTRIYGGLGLGLAIVRQLTELHGGSVQADSPGLNKGATFTVRLPVRAVSHSECEEVGVHPSETSKLPDSSRLPCLDRVRVLVVDDEPDSREMVKAVLEVCGAQVTMAASAQEALALLDRLAFDVLLSDIGMPQMDGYGLIQRVRMSQTNMAQMPAAALTAYARPQDRTRALLAGFQQHLSKPVEPTELMAVVATLSGRTGDPTST